MKQLGLILITTVLVACSPKIIQYPNGCPHDDTRCQRNLNAETLAAIGQPDAAVQLMRTDPFIDELVGECGEGR